MEQPDPTLEPIFWRDEILQILYWLHGEGLGEVVAPLDLTSLLGVSADVAAEQLEKMVQDGFVSQPKDAPDRYQLTEWGLTEGKRHFAEEFAGLTNQGHGECNNPNCACHTLGPEYCEHLPA